jgi:hypothetical protein
LGGGEGGGVGKGGGGGKREEMTQTLYAYMNKRKKINKILKIKRGLRKVNHLLPLDSLT